MSQEGKVAVQSRMKAIDNQFLLERLDESRRILKTVVERSQKPLIIQFSGGSDSLALVGLVREVTENFVCCYMVSGIEFDESIEFAARMGRELGVTLLFSQPDAHKGGFFKRIAQFRRFPGIPPNFPWCVRDLKLRPQKKIIEKNFGKGEYFKLNGVRRWESGRRKLLYPSDRLISADPEHNGSWQVQPLLNWNEADVANYLERRGLPTSDLYRKYGVSGCYWCPFYQADIYRGILRHEPNLYDRFIEWEEILGAPSVIGEIYLRDLKKEVMSESNRD
jgi:3'-phosphoadenosine 5'-phosphosulfate sulfotransferase (PAPS reductase)/FAD synthetase